MRACAKMRDMTFTDFGIPYRRASPWIFHSTSWPWPKFWRSQISNVNMTSTEVDIRHRMASLWVLYSVTWPSFQGQFFFYAFTITKLRRQRVSPVMLPQLARPPLWSCSCLNLTYNIISLLLFQLQNRAQSHKSWRMFASCQKQLAGRV